jgi:uncharacterized protein (DUF2236 family)
VVSRQVNAERLVLLAWSRAILLQAAHPLIAAGIVDHSHFRASGRAATARLKATVRAMLAIAFGDAAEHRRSIETIRHVHRRINGTLRVPTGVFPAGSRYSAEDPDLVLWVHGTQTESVVLLYEKLFGALTPAERDAYCDEVSEVAIELGAKPDEVPRTWAALGAYLEREYASGRIAVGPDARTIGDALLFPPFTALPSPFAWMNRVITIGLLPANIREQYRYGWSERRARQFHRVLSAIRGLHRITPRVVAWWPEARRDAVVRATSTSSSTL